MSNLTILYILTLAPLAMGVAAVIAAALFVFVAVIAREEYTARGMAKRASQTFPKAPKAYQVKPNTVATLRRWENQGGSPWDVPPVEALERDTALAHGNRVFTVDTDGICSVMSEARAFATTDPSTETYIHEQSVYLGALHNEQAKWPNIDTTHHGEPLHAKRLLTAAARREELLGQLGIN